MPAAARIFFRYWVPVLIWASLIFSASTDLGSVHHTSRIIGPTLRWLFPGITDASIGLVQTFIRKSGHATEYAVLTLLFWRARYQPKAAARRPWSHRLAGQAWFAAVVYAASDEFHQSFYPSREASVRDVGIDSAGAAAGLLLLYAFGCWRTCWSAKKTISQP